MIDIATVLFQAGITTAGWVSIACSLKDLMMQRLSALPAYSDYWQQTVLKRVRDWQTTESFLEHQFPNKKAC